MQKWLELAIESTRLAAEILTKEAKRAHTVHSEQGRDIKLEADRLAERAILDCLQAGTDFPVLSEEAGQLPGATSEYRWIIDPLDGTYNFQREIPMFCTSVGLWQGDQPVLGVIRDLNREEVFTAIIGKGAWLNGAPIHVSTIQDKAKGTICAGLSAYGGEYSDAWALEFAKRVQQYKKVRMIGSAALSLAYVACGRVEAYVEEHIALWDIAAGAALIRAAGGTIEIMPTPKPNIIKIRASNGVLKL